MTDLELIHGLVDGELEGSELAAARARVNADPAFRAHYEAARQQKEFVKANLAPATCAETWSKCRGRMDELDRTQRAESFITKYAWQMVACLFLFMVSAGAYNRMGNRTVNAGAVTTATATMGPNVATAERVENWVARKLGLRTSQEQRNITYLSVAESQVEGRPMWKIDLLDNGVPLSLVVIANAPVIQGLNDQGGETQHGQMNGQNCVAWRVREYTCLLVGERDLSDLEELSKILVR